MTRAVLALAAAGLVSLSALATPASAHVRPCNPWPWRAGIANGWGPVYSLRGVYAADAVWDAYLRSNAVAPYVRATAFLVADGGVVPAYIDPRLLRPEKHHSHHHHHRARR